LGSACPEQGAHLGLCQAGGVADPLRLVGHAGARDRLRALALATAPLPVTGRDAVGDRGEQLPLDRPGGVLAVYRAARGGVVWQLADEPQETPVGQLVAAQGLP
jgi:hypothetical protein